MGIHGIILEHVLNGLNILESGSMKEVIINTNIDDKWDANNLAGKISNYNVKVEESMGYYLLKISKKEKK
ncbi:MAG: hypothetical protein WC812_01385 [Candidatus Pacearchaeota archaeon]|jgi:hypothetical protein